MSRRDTPNDHDTGAPYPPTIVPPRPPTHGYVPISDAKPEPVLWVYDYWDGPLFGVAMYAGVPHWFDVSTRGYQSLRERAANGEPNAQIRFLAEFVEWLLEAGQEPSNDPELTPYEWPYGLDMVGWWECRSYVLSPVAPEIIPLLDEHWQLWLKKRDFIIENNRQPMTEDEAVFTPEELERYKATSPTEFYRQRDKWLDFEVDAWLSRDDVYWLPYAPPLPHNP